MALSKTPPQPPPDFSLTPESIIQKMKATIEKRNQGIAKLQDMVTRTEPESATFNNLVAAKLHLEGDLHHEAYLEYLQYLSPDAAIRDAAREAGAITDSGNELRESYDHFKAVYSADKELDHESKRALRITMGIARPEKVQPGNDRVNEINRRLCLLRSEFKENLSPKSDGIWLTEHELQGLSREILGSLEKGAGENEGKLRVPYHNSMPILSDVVNPTTRKRWYVAKHASYFRNVPLFKEHVKLSHERAVIHGYPNHASYTLSSNKVDSLDEVRKLLQKAHERGLKANASDLESRKKAKLNDSQAEDKAFYFWDYYYYEDYSRWGITAVEQPENLERKMLDEENDSKPKFKNYFPLPPTVHRMFTIFETVFGVVFEKIEGNFWHENVELYAVWDEEAIGGEFCGYVYLDLYERSGKYPTSCNFPIQPRHISSNGDIRYLSTIVTCNFEPPTAATPCLLDHFDLTTLFHEMGHCLHSLFARVRFYFSGADWGNSEFRETASMLCENWCYIPDQLKMLSGHYKTGKQLPDHLVKEIVDNRDKHTKVFNLGHILHVSFDLAVHTPVNQKEADEMDIPALWKQMRIDIQNMKEDENSKECYLYCGSGHIVSGDPGKMIMYIYGYFSAEYIWKKLFTKDPMSREAGMRWRRGYLEKGCSQDPVEMLKRLLGSWPNMDGLCNDDNESEESGSASETSDAA